MISILIISELVEEKDLFRVQLCKCVILLVRFLRFVTGKQGITLLLSPELNVEHISSNFAVPPISQLKGSVYSQNLSCKAPKKNTQTNKKGQSVETLSHNSVPTSCRTHM